MNIEIPEEVMAATATTKMNDDHSHVIVKGRRTKRQRLLQLITAPPPATAASSSTSTSSAEFFGSTTEEEDMANCLILLAQGQALESRREEEGGVGGAGEKFTSRRFAEAATTTNGKAGFYVYECKTCNKCFPSFQALGGHRASHKKPKTAPPLPAVAATEDKKAIGEESLLINIASFPPATATATAAAAAAITATTTNNNKSRVHECSICGSEFSSGQALGGHMRRHRPAAHAAAVPETEEEVKKEKNILALDLNLPAPSDDDRGDFLRSPAFPFAGNQPSLVFSASALVDCHY